MLEFTHDSQPGRVIFGAGRRERLADELARLGATRALVLCTPGQRGLGEWVAGLLGERAAGIYAGAVLHVPVEAAMAARAEAQRLGADSCVAIGGGSTIGLAKAIALESGLPIVAVPTTYAGSEMTPIWGLTEAGLKRTGRDPRVLPRSVIYDPELTTSLPPHVAGPSGINALAHCVEALYAPDASPIVALIAEEGIRSLAASLPTVVRTPGDIDARARALYGAWLAGTSLGGAAMGLHHKLCHTLGGSFNLPHAEVHTVILPHAAAYNAAMASEAMARVARALGAESAPGAIYDLAAMLGAPTALRAIGMREEDLDTAAELATRSPYPNPAPVNRDGVRQLLDDAFYGRRPAK
ncbi:MAG TPA: maleylacetate reductase [Roseiflexaceae bacterium]|nr:maleylacetate reductase [Roseiflexaceae bacterium]